MGRRRIPIPGWSDDEVSLWLRTNRGTAGQCVTALFPDLEGAERSRAYDRCREMVKKLKAEGLDFEKRPNLVSLPKPKAAPPSPRRKATPPPAEFQNDGPAVSSMTRAQALAWTIDQAAASVLTLRTSPATTLKYISEAQAELEALRRKQGEEGLSPEALREMWPRLLATLPADLLDDAVGEYLSRHPKQTIAPKKRATG